MASRILGISAFYHDSAACLLVNGEIIACAQEERFTRIKQDSSFPIKAIKYCLEEGKLNPNDLTDIVFYDNPYKKLNRIIATSLSYPLSSKHFFKNSIANWFKKSLNLDDQIRGAIAVEFQCLADDLPRVDLVDHHQSHAASAFYPSPYKEAAILCVDGVGEWDTTSLWLGNGHKLSKLSSIEFPHSLGLLYSAFTWYLGFKVNSGEYKLMGLAPYGRPLYKNLIYNNLIHFAEDGSFQLNMEYFTFPVKPLMIGKKFENLFKSKVRQPESKLEQIHMDIARSIQDVLEEAMVGIARYAAKQTNSNNLCIAGGVALNCKANSKIIEKNIFKNLWIQPAAGDAGGALGCALTLYHEKYPNERMIYPAADKMKGSYLGPSFDDREIESYLNSVNASFNYLKEPELFEQVAQAIEQGNVIGWFQGRMEYGPRALGNRSIIGDPRSDKMQSIMNLKIKKRESFRPFAPSVLKSKSSQWFDLKCESPYMLFVANVKKEKCLELTAQEEHLTGLESLKIRRTVIPAVVHVDYSSRLQTVSEETNERYYNLIKTFYKNTNCPILINTSFNVRGEPIVCTPEDAMECFMSTDIDYLVMGNFVLNKAKQNQLRNFSPKRNFIED